MVSRRIYITRFGKLRIIVFFAAKANTSGVYYSGVADSDMPRYGSAYNVCLLEGSGKEYVGYVGVASNKNIIGVLFTPGGAAQFSSNETYGSMSYMVN